jgi:hypothetical protein
MKTLLALLALLLVGCASPEPRETYAPRALPVAQPVEILIETHPAGGVVDWNGNVLGAAPVTLKIRPDLNNYGRPIWPNTGAAAHIFRARWRNGDRAAELFMPDEMPPQRIAIISPVQEIYWGYEKKKPLAKFP